VVPTGRDESVEVEGDEKICPGEPGLRMRGWSLILRKKRGLEIQNHYREGPKRKNQRNNQKLLLFLFYLHTSTPSNLHTTLPHTP
jgi:hypothetical protein